MSSANPKAHEPSMEEILASIRRIIADDQEGMRGAPFDVGERGGPLTNVLDLAERPLPPSRIEPYREPRPAAPREPLPEAIEPVEDDLAAVAASFNEFSQHDDDGDAASEPEPPAAPAPEPAFSDPRRTDTLLSSAANASIAESFTRLGSTVMPAKPQTLDDLMREMLRPMLKSWLDDTLPGLVERLIQAEIERISRSRR